MAEGSSEQIRVLYFASASTFTKKRSESFKVPGSLTGLFEMLESRYPGFRKQVLSCSAITLNLEYVDIEDETSDSPIILRGGDEIGIIPPVSSG